MESARPDVRLRPAVYSNFDHELKPDIVKQLEADPNSYAQHAAWDFCGYVWRGADGIWRDEVWQYREPVEVLYSNTIEGAIAFANKKYGAK